MRVCVYISVYTLVYMEQHECMHHMYIYNMHLHTCIYVCVYTHLCTCNDAQFRSVCMPYHM